MRGKKGKGERGGVLIMGGRECTPIGARIVCGLQPW